MSETDKPIAGGCLCGALRYTADKAPAYAGYCFCADCRKASGSGWVGFMGFDECEVIGASLRDAATQAERLKDAEAKMKTLIGRWYA